MRRKFAIVLTSAMMLSLAACGTQDNASGSKFKAGTYEGTAKGFGGDIKATVTLSGDKIEKIEVTGDKETQGIGSVAVEKLPAKMLETQTVNVDGVSGATVSSGAIITAVTSAFEKAGVDVSKLQAVESDKKEATKETLNVDTVVVGAGGAGMTAALEAKAAGMNVIIVEKASYSGGNTSRATGGMNAAETKTQKSTRVIPIPKSIIEIVKSYKSDSQYFISSNESPYEPRKINYQLKALLKRSGVRDIKFHTLRHTFASQLAINETPILTIKKLMNHNDINATMRYAKLSKSSGEKHVNNLIASFMNN